MGSNNWDGVQKAAGRAVPAFGQGGKWHDMRMGNTTFDMRDPRFLAALALAPVAPGQAAMLGAGYAGSSVDNERTRRKREGYASQQANTNQQLARQQNIMGGTTGGMGFGREMTAYQAPYQQYTAQQGAYEQQQFQQQMQALMQIQGLASFFMPGGYNGG